MNEIIGTKVNVPGAAGQATLRYVGGIQGKNGVFAGLELAGTLAATRGKNSGSVNNVQYFQVDVPMSGLFLPYDRLRSVNVKLPESKTYLASANTEAASSSAADTAAAAAVAAAPAGAALAAATSAASPSPSVSLPVVSPKSPPHTDPAVALASSAFSNTKFASTAATTNTNSPYGSTPHLIEGSTQTSSTFIRSPLSPLNQGGYQSARMNMMNENLYRSEPKPAANAIAEYESEIKELRKVVREKDRRLEHFTKQREEWHTAMDNLMAVQQDGMQVFEDRIQELEEVNAKQAAEIRRLNEELNSSETHNQQLEGEIEVLKAEKENIKASDVDMDAEAAEAAEAEEKLEKLQDLNRQQSSEMESLRKELDQSKQLIAELEKYKSQHPGSVDAIAQDIQNFDLLGSSLGTISRDNNSQPGEARANNAVFAKPSNTPITMNTAASILANTASATTDLLGLDIPTDLPIYKAPTSLDPAAGKTDWCGICERDGHSSINCPFETDIF